MQQPLLLFFGLGLIVPALAQTLSPTPTSEVTIATAPNSPLATLTGLPRLVAQLPPCAIPCFESAARNVNCSPTDFQCLCRSSNTGSLGVSIGGCLGGGALLGGNNSGNDKGDGCELDNLGDLAQLASGICSAVSQNPDPSQLAQATSIVSAALASASATSTGAGASESGRPNGAVKVEGTAKGMLVVVAAYAFVAF